MSSLNVNEMKSMLKFISNGMIANQDLLSQADRAIGDGDHGVGMTRGFEALLDRLQEAEFSTIGELLSASGITLMNSIGGAAGAIFGSFFTGGAENLTDQSEFNSQSLAKFLNDGLEAVQSIGKADAGDKTMVDALEPAALLAKTMITVPLDVSLPKVSVEAKKGMVATKDMIATVGKAKTLGERSLGYPDPGAISTALILQFMAEYVLKEKGIHAG